MLSATPPLGNATLAVRLLGVDGCIFMSPDDEAYLLDAPDDDARLALELPLIDDTEREAADEL